MLSPKATVKRFVTMQTEPDRNHVVVVYIACLSRRSYLSSGEKSITAAREHDDANVNSTNARAFKGHADQNHGQLALT